MAATLRLAFGQLVCAVQRVLLDFQLLGEGLFLLFEGPKLKAEGGELILVGARGFCDLGSSAEWLSVTWWRLRGVGSLDGSRTILGVFRGELVVLSLGWCHRGLVFRLRTRWAPLLGSSSLSSPNNVHTRR